MRPNPFLIPRFNFDYSTNDLHIGLKSIFKDELDMRSMYPIFGPRKIFFTNYGRTALYVILKSLNLPPKSKIGVPLYCCTVVFDAIMNAGHVPKFIDINNNYTIDPQDLKEKIYDVSALIVVHTFGRPADMDTIKKIAGNIPIIEDCSHSLLSEYKGKITGTIGDMSIFSLSKYLSAGGGGLLVINNNSFHENIEKEINNLQKPSKLGEIKHSINAYIRTFFYNKPWFGIIGLPVGLLLENRVDLMAKKSTSMAKGYKSDTEVTLNKIKYFKEKVEVQRKNSFFLLDQLKDFSLSLPYEERDTYCNYYLLPLRISERDEKSTYLRKRGIDTTNLFSLVPQIARIKYGYTDNCPFTEKVTKSIITIPNHYSLKEKELKDITDIIRSYPGF